MQQFVIKSMKNCNNEKSNTADSDEEKNEKKIRNVRIAQCSLFLRKIIEEAIQEIRKGKACYECVYWNKEDSCNHFLPDFPEGWTSFSKIEEILLRAFQKIIEGLKRSSEPKDDWGYRRGVPPTKKN